MTEPWLHVIGIGADGLDGLSADQRRRVAEAEFLVGGARHLAMASGFSPAEQLTWEIPLERTVTRIRDARGRRVVVLATGDPMWFGIGVTLARAFAPGDYVISPSLSAFTLAASRLGWPLADTVCLTVHGRPIELILRHLLPDARLLILSENGETPAEVAALITTHGYGASLVTVLAELGGAEESRWDGAAADWSWASLPDLNTIAIICQPDRDASPRWSGVPGLPDRAFTHDGQLTKQPIRAATLAALAPLPGELLWDIGAGSGAIAIEWLRAARGTRAIAIERSTERGAMIRTNAASLGTPDLKVVQGSAPDALSDLPAPDAVFIGGGVTIEGVFEAAWAALKPGGRLVANVVTLEGEALLLARHGQLGGSLTRFSISRAEPVGPHQAWRPLMPVTQLLLEKPRS
jgi:precorrin-6Y C5,15-methyltransferase (decarboxylating)